MPVGHVLEAHRKRSLASPRSGGNSSPSLRPARVPFEPSLRRRSDIGTQHRVGACNGSGPRECTTPNLELPKREYKKPWLSSLKSPRASDTSAPEPRPKNENARAVNAERLPKSGAVSGQSLERQPKNGNLSGPVSGQSLERRPKTGNLSGPVIDQSSETQPKSGNGSGLSAGWTKNGKTGALSARFHPTVAQPLADDELHGHGCPTGGVTQPTPPSQHSRALAESPRQVREAAATLAPAPAPLRWALPADMYTLGRLDGEKGQDAFSSTGGTSWAHPIYPRLEQFTLWKADGRNIQAPQPSSQALDVVSAMSGETPREAANRRKREAADKERDRIMEATIEHVATQPVRPRLGSQVLCDSVVGSCGDNRQMVGPWLDDDADPSVETPTQAARRRKQEAGDREAERLRREAPEVVHFLRPSAPALPEEPPAPAPYPQAGAPALARITEEARVRPPRPGTDVGETPRAAARRRKCEASDQAVARLKQSHGDEACASRRIALQLRDAHARSFLAPFATGVGARVDAETPISKLRFAPPPAFREPSSEQCYYDEGVRNGTPAAPADGLRPLRDSGDVTRLSCSELPGDSVLLSPGH